MSELKRFFIGTFSGISLSGILGYFGIQGECLLIMSIFLVLDLILGLLSAKARGEKIESEKCQKGLIKKITRWILPFIIAGGLKWTGLEHVDILISIVMGIIIFSELYSCVGHIYAINYGEKLPEMDAFKILINKVSIFLKNLMKKEIDSIPDAEEKEEKEEKK